MMVTLPLEIPTRNRTRRRYERDVQTLSNLALWLRLNEQQNYTVHNSGTAGAALDGTWTPGNGDIGYDGYRINDAYLFDKKVTKIVIPNHVILGTMTTQAWAFRIKATSLGLANLGHFFGWSGGAFNSNKNYATFTNNNNIALSLNTTGTDAGLVTTNGACAGFVGQNKWAWVFFDFDDANVLGNGRKFRLFFGVDGVLSTPSLSSNGAATGTVINMTDSLGIGSTAVAGSGHTDGLMDEAICRPASLWTTAEMQMLIDGTQQFRSAARILADDTRELQALFDAGGTINLDAGRTYYSRRLMVSPSTIEGNDATIISINGNSNAVIRNKNVDTGDTGITIRNLNINGNSANQTNVNTCHGFGFYKATNVTLENCVSNDNERDGFYFGGGAIDGFTLNGGCVNVVMTDCEANDNRRNGVSLIRVNGVVIDNLDWAGNNIGVLDNPGVYDAGGIDFEPNGAADTIQNVEILNSHGGAGYSQPIALRGSNAATKDDIWIHDCFIGTEDDPIIGGEQAIAFFATATNVVVEDTECWVDGSSGIWFNGQTNIIDGVEVNRCGVFGNDTALVAGVGFNYVHNGVINDNHMTDFGKPVLIFACDVIDITDNEFTSCLSGVDVTGGSTNVTQSGNITN